MSATASEKFMGREEFLVFEDAPYTATVAERGDFWEFKVYHSEPVFSVVSGKSAWLGKEYVCQAALDAIRYLKARDTETVTPVDMGRKGS